MRVKIEKSAFLVLLVLLHVLSAVPLRAAPGDEPARRLTPRGQENLVAFTKLLGYVRFFHPSDQAAVADWERLALAGVQEAERAVNAVDLARTLEDFFRPLAPTLRVFPSGDRPELPAALSPPSANPQVIYWEHRGVSLGPESGEYESRRLTATGAPPAAAGLRVPGEPLEVSLGGGVSALVPMTLYRDDGGTLPHIGADAANAADVQPPEPDKPEGFVPSGNDRATRLAAVALGWTVFEHFYPYFDTVQVDWPGELVKALDEAARLPGEVNFLNTLRGMVAALQDGHGSVIHPSKVFTHQLPLAWHWIEDKLVVTHADRRAPGIARGDVIVSINGRPILQAIASEEKLVSASTPQHRRWRTLQRMLRGSPNEAVRLKVQRARGGTASLVLRRAVLFPLAEPKPEKITEIRPGIFYVDLDRISTQDFRDAIGQLAAARGIIFDLRGYPNNVSVLPLSYLAGQTLRSAIFNTPLITRPSREGIRFTDSGWPVQQAFPRLTDKVAFITDGRAVSYAETYMGIVESFRLAEIVGGPTAGTNGNVNPFALPGGYTVFWTGMQVLKHDGSRHHGVGIQPTVPVTRTLKAVTEGRDELLEKAIEVVTP